MTHSSESILEHAQSFPDYSANTTETGIGFYVFVLVYSALSFLLIAPLVIWGRKYQREREAALLAGLFYNQQDEFAVYENSNGSRQHHTHHHHTQEVHPLEQPHDDSRDPDSPFRDPRLLQPVYAPPGARAAAVRTVFRGIDRVSVSQKNVRRYTVTSVFGEVINLTDHLLEKANTRRPLLSLFSLLLIIQVATTAYPDDDPDYQSILSGSQNRGGLRNNNNTPSNRSQTTTGAASSSQPSNVPSAATTSRLYDRPKPKTQVWDVHARRWKSRRPIGRPAVIHSAFKEETNSMGGSSNQSERKSLRRARFFEQNPNSKSHAMMSDVASSILTDDFDGPPLQQQRVIINYQRRHHHHRRGYSNNGSSDRSFLAEVVDDISPNDAADAGDPGRRNSFEHVEPIELTVCFGPGALWKPQTIAAAIDGLIELAEPDLELKRILEIGIPLTFGAMSHELFHLINMAFIANFISSDSMVAYVIVHLMLGLTNELIGAISDAESTLCAHALTTGNWFLAGQYAQIAIMMVLLVNIPLLLMWATVMDDLVLWLVGSEEIAEIAQQYTKAILIYQLLQGVSRTLTVLFHLTGNEKFETRFALGEGLVMMIATCLTAALSEKADLLAVGIIQLIIGSATFVVKVAYALLRGWLRVFLKGMTRSCAFRVSNNNNEWQCFFVKV